MATDLPAGADDALEVDLEVDLEEDRYARLRLIPWWDQERLAAARVLVVGAGALGNELCKNLALLGVGRIMVVDMDSIEDTNLTRSVFFRHRDQGQPKAEVIARAVRDLNPDVRIEARVANVIHDLGQGVFRDMDIVFGGLDNREARVWINAVSWKLGKPWVDGAIEIVQGVARLFVPPDGPCYECTMSDMDYKLLSMRRSCALLTREDVVEGKVPTTPTTASVIAGVQVQEAVKWLHRDRGLPLLAGRGFAFNGLTHDSYVVEYQRREDCPAHETLGEVLATGLSARTATARQVLELVRAQVSPGAVLEFDRELCTAFTCRQCQTRSEVFQALGRLSGKDAACPQCGEPRDAELTHAFDGSEDFLDRPLAALGVPIYDIVRGRDGMNAQHFVLDGDRAEALGSLA
jgi:molybdopterin/thiamine biosynthesis adenylyltransferase